MSDRSRREFMRESSLAAAALLATSRVLADETPLPDGTPAPHGHGKPPARRSATLHSVRSGNWSDVATWGGRVPGTKDIVQVAKGHVVLHDSAQSAIAGAIVAPGGTLEFDPARSTTLQCTGNMIVEGFLRMRPADAKQAQTLRFVGIDESKFIGGGMDPLDSDVGLWVVGAGKLDLLGGAKTAWTRAAGNVKVGATRLELRDVTGWQVGDRIVVVPTDAPTHDSTDWDDKDHRPLDPFMAKFERRAIQSIDGKTITLDAPLAFDHGAVVTGTDKSWTAEVANLSRNVRIEGTASGRAHIFIRSSAPQSVRYVEGSFLGPRNVQQGHRRPQLVQGRYALHFHHCYEGSRGTLVEGCALYDTGNRAYVPHTSHGITMRDNVAFHCQEAGFWWDFQELTHDTVWERNLVALVASNGIDRTTMGMTLGQGDGNVARNNVVVYGHQGDPHGHGGYVWDANNEGVWIFEGNLSHSNRTGLFVWQNTSLNHTIVNHESYNDFLAIFHGAYTNSYTYTGGYIYNGLVRVKATSGNASGVRFEKLTFDGADQQPSCAEIYPSPVPSDLDTNVFRECTFRNAPVAVSMNTFPIGSENVRKHVDLILCEFIKINRLTDFAKEATPDSWFRIQPLRGKCDKIVHATGREEVLPFAPYHYGTGTGLTGSYFIGSAFEQPAFKRIDSMVMFQQWSIDKGASPVGVHHAITGDEYSVRWTGQIEPQFSEAYTFRVQGGAGFRLWIDDKLVIDGWKERPDNDAALDSAPLDLTFGRKLDVRLETFNSSGARGSQLFWQCPSLGRMVHVPQSQLYPDPRMAMGRRP